MIVYLCLDDTMQQQGLPMYRKELFASKVPNEIDCYWVPALIPVFEFSDITVMR